jgi:hypothetical protein
LLRSFAYRDKKVVGVFVRFRAPLQTEFSGRLFLENRKAGLGTAFTFMGSSGHGVNMILFLKWMLIFLIIQMT